MSRRLALWLTLSHATVAALAWIAVAGGGRTDPRRLTAGEVPTDLVVYRTDPDDRFRSRVVLARDPADPAFRVQAAAPDERIGRCRIHLNYRDGRTLVLFCVNEPVDGPASSP